MMRVPGMPGGGGASRVVTPILLLLLPIAFFLALFHPETLSIGNVGWLIDGSDNGENALGAHAYWHDRHAGASLRTSLLNAPDGVSMLFTDSSPLMTLVAKPFAALMPADAQLVGPFVLVSLILQAVFAWLLLRPHAPGPLALWAGVALLAFPPTLANRFVHVNLMAHWTILAALWLFLNPERGRQARWWAPLIAVTALIHSYLLVMVGAIWAAAMLDRFIGGSRRVRVATGAQAAAMLALVAMLAAWMGVGASISTGTFGAFAMHSDALWNPGVYASWTLLPKPAGDPGEWSEGFQYLGAGALLLIVAAVAIGWRRPARDAEAIVLGRLRALAPALIVLGLLAVMRLPLPDGVLAVLDPVRASGRLFWPVGYVLVLVAILAVYRLSARQAGLVIGALLATQTVDLVGIAHPIRAQSRRAADPRLYHRTPDPRWDRLVAQAGSVAFMPGDVIRDLDLFQEVAWRAVGAGRPVSNVYAARTSPATARRLGRERAAFVAGERIPGRLYVLLPSTPSPPADMRGAIVIDGVTVIPPQSSGVQY